MRKFIIGVLLAASGLAFSQTEDIIRIDSAYTSMREFPAIQIQVDGAQDIDNVSTSSSEQIYWAWDPTGQTPNSSMISAYDYENGSQVAQLVADGSTLFALNTQRNCYIAHHYATTTAPSTSTYNMDLLQHFDFLSTFRGSYAARLLQEALGGVAASYSPWSAGTMTLLPDNEASATDPITGQVYTAAPGIDYVMYEIGGKVSQSIVFQRTNMELPDGTMQPIITQVFIAESDQLDPNNPKTTQLVLAVTPLTTLPTGAQFSFAPPSGAKILQSTGLASG